MERRPPQKDDDGPRMPMILPPEPVAVPASDHVVEEHYPMVLATCLRVLRTSADAEDAAQETFRKLLEQDLSAIVNLGGWLHRCAYTTALDLLRHRRSRAHAAMEDVPEASPAGPTEAVDRLDTAQAVADCLDELGDDHRNVLLAYFWGGASQATIAARIGISQVAVKKRLDRALDHLRLVCRRRGLAVASLLVVLGAEVAAAEAAAAATTATLPLAPSTTAATSTLTTLLTAGGVILSLVVLALVALREPSDQSHAAPRDPGREIRVVAPATTSAAAPPSATILHALPVDWNLIQAWSISGSPTLETTAGTLRLRSSGAARLETLTLPIADLPLSFRLDLRFRCHQHLDGFARLLPGLRPITPKAERGPIRNLGGDSQGEAPPIGRPVLLSMQVWRQTRDGFPVLRRRILCDGRLIEDIEVGMAVEDAVVLALISVDVEILDLILTPLLEAPPDAAGDLDVFF